MHTNTDRRRVFERPDAKGFNVPRQRFEQKLKEIRKKRFDLAKQKHKYALQLSREQLHNEKKTGEDTTLKEGQPLESKSIQERAKEIRKQRKERRLADGTFKKASRDSRTDQQQTKNEEIALKRQGREQTLKKREEERKIMSKYTRRGQPVMGARIKMLLDKLESQDNEDTKINEENDLQTKVSSSENKVVHSSTTMQVDEMGTSNPRKQKKSKEYVKQKPVGKSIKPDNPVVSFEQIMDPEFGAHSKTKKEPKMQSKGSSR